MNAFLLLTGSGTLAILTSYASVEEPALLRKLSAKGIDKFLWTPIPIDLARERYGAHFDVVINDLAEADDLRVLDYNGERAFRRFRFDELAPLSTHEAPRVANMDRIAA
jgi:hypothetical protein